MLTFKKFAADQELSESGMSFRGVTTSRISKENVGPTSAQVIDKLTRFGFKKSDFELLGSTGKKDTSGDIDLGVHTDPLLRHFNMDIGSLTEALKKLQVFLAGNYGDVKVLFGNQVSFAVPVLDAGGKPTGAFCQLDLMFTPSLEASSFYYHSPAASESDYKGAIRTMLLMAIAIHFDRKDLGNGTEERYWFDKWYGLVKGIETKVGSKRVSANKREVTSVPDEIVHMLLGPSFSRSDTNSFETIWKAIHSSKFVSKENLSAIVQTFSEMLRAAKMPLPKEV